MWLLYTSETFVLVVLPVAVGLLSVLFSLPLPSLCFSLPPSSLPLSLSLSPLSERTFGTNRGTLITSFLLLVSFSVRVPLEYRVREPARSPIIRFPFTRYYHVFPIPRIDLSHAFRALSFLSLGSNSTSGRKLFNALARLFIDLVRATVNYLGRRERDILLSTGERERERERGPG